MVHSPETIFGSFYVHWPVLPLCGTFQADLPCNSTVLPFAVDAAAEFSLNMRRRLILKRKEVNVRNVLNTSRSELVILIAMYVVGPLTPHPSRDIYVILGFTFSPSHSNFTLHATRTARPRL